MIILNNIKFAENEKEFIESLFHGKATCSGYAKRLKHQVKLFDMQKKLIGVINKHGVLCKATLQDNGKVWYSLADIDLLGEYDYTKQYNDIQNIVVMTNYVSNDSIRHYK